MPDENEALDQLIRQGNAEALAQYFEWKRPQLLAFIERQLGAGLRRKLEPGDVFQEVCAEALRTLPQAPLNEREPIAWLFQLAERRIIDAHRHFFGAQKRDAAREIGLDVQGNNTGAPALINMLVKSMTTPSQAFSRNVREERLHAALAALPNDQREALRLRYVENLPSKEIADRLGKSDASIRVMLTRALKKLEELIGSLG